jgi:single-strand DNA-binding protein
MRAPYLPRRASAATRRFIGQGADATAGSVNKVILIGNLGKDPEVWTTQDGQKIATLTLATSESWTDRNSGERAQGADRMAPRCHSQRPHRRRGRTLPAKGRKMFVEGALQTRKWTDQSGQERHTTEVVIQRFRGDLVLLDSQRGEDGSTGESGGGYRERASASARGSTAGAPRNSGPAWEAPKGGSLDDEIPF